MLVEAFMLSFPLWFILLAMLMAIVAVDGMK